MWGLFEEKILSGQTSLARTGTGTVQGKRGPHSIPSHTNLEQKKRKRNVRPNPGAPNGNPFLIMAANKPS